MSTERRCPWWKFCQCEHAACYAGWLDADRLVMQRGRVQRHVVWCPKCAEARDRQAEAKEMESEVAAHRRKRGR